MRAQVTGTRLGQKANLNLYIVNLAQSLQAANWGIGESLTPRANHWCRNWGIGESLVLKLENRGILLPLWRIIVTKVGELNFRESNFGESNFYTVYYTTSRILISSTHIFLPQTIYHLIEDIWGILNIYFEENWWFHCGEKCMARRG